MTSWLACLVLSLVPQEPPSPLAPLPAGWRAEHLEFPLSFAPELELRGAEDLAFAPGMFVPDSDSYFSYALALRLEGDVVVDAEMLARFLETYYRGLCRAVAEGRGFARDASTVRARVRREGDLFRATVELFDPFTNGQDLELALELRVHATPRATEVLGLASPLDAGAPVWSELHALGAAWQATRPAPVFLNHVYWVVERETYDALVSSTFLREAFAVSEERATVRGDVSYTGFYLYGRRTYVEFLAPQPEAGLVAGMSGLALGVETPGTLTAFAQRLEQRELGSQGAAVTRELDGEQVPWFQMLGVEMPSAPLTLFALEYDSRFLERWHAELVPLQRDLTRAAVLERYAAVLERSALRSGAPFADVRAVELALDDAQRERLLGVFSAAGHEIEPGTDAWTCRAPQCELRLTRASTPGGVTALELALRRPVEHEPLTLGALRLSFAGTTAHLAPRP